MNPLLFVFVFLATFECVFIYFEEMSTAGLNFHSFQRPVFTRESRTALDSYLTVI